MFNFGERLKFFRINVLKMKRKQFCERYSLPIISVQSWENSGVKISKRQCETLEEKLIKDGIRFNAAWLFNGEGEPWDALKDTPDTHNLPLKDPSGACVHTIDSYFYEPLLKKNAVLTLDPISLTDINCPAFIALMDMQQTMHFGIIMLTSNKGYIMEAFQGTFYKLTVSDSDILYLIKNVSLYS